MLDLVITSNITPFHIRLKNKYGVIKGDSATGKTLLTTIIQEFSESTIMPEFDGYKVYAYTCADLKADIDFSKDKNISHY